MTWGRPDAGGGGRPREKSLHLDLQDPWINADQEGSRSESTTSSYCLELGHSTKLTWGAYSRVTHVVRRMQCSPPKGRGPSELMSSLPFPSTSETKYHTLAKSFPILFYLIPSQTVVRNSYRRYMFKQDSEQRHPDHQCLFHLQTSFCDHIT